MFRTFLLTFISSPEKVKWPHTMAKFKAVESQVDFPKLEEELLEHWYKDGIVEKYLKKNTDADEKFSFLDGPITANNPMGVHHAWGRTYKDVWQRYWNMRGKKERFQNGFDEQGLWVEVEVEKELGLKNKKDIENLVPGDTFKSLEKFINLCKERVKKYAAIQTDQSKRLGYFMDWDHSYHTSSDENNYAIWNFLKVVNEKGWLYKGHDSVPWCPRCGTAISQHEILTEEYKEITHETVYFKLPVTDRKDESLLVWTTTPWTIPANVAVAVNPKEEYGLYEVEEGKLWVMQKRAQALQENGILPKTDKLEAKKGSELVGWEYEGPFDDLLLVKETFGDYDHRVIDGGDVVTEFEGTGLLHVAPGAGEEDFKLGKENKLPVIAPIEEDASYVQGMNEFTGQNAKWHPKIIIDYLREKDGGRFLFKTQQYTHRYPTCWRCKTELVWRVVDEWYIAMDKADESGKTYREQMVAVAKKVNWAPRWGLDRELDWLKNMHDWLISKKRYWGLALPIWECTKCGNFEVIGGREELKEKASTGFDQFDGNSPHRPWVDQIMVTCTKCGESISRIPDVGNPWLDAGIVPFSTMPEDWFPADFITESFPGQFKNWFYSLIAMSTALKRTNPFENILGFASVVDEKGEEMHKSKGNAIEFNEAASKAGVDPMRWLYVTQNPEHNLKFGYNNIDEVRRRFYLILWNSYKFFTDYANLSNWHCELIDESVRAKLTVLDRWILASLTRVVLLANERMEHYDAMAATRAIEDFVINDLSTWYIRRSRSRVGISAAKEDQEVFLATLYGVLVTLSKLVAPFTPFVAEVMYQNLTSDESVHLANYPLGDKSLLDDNLIDDMSLLRNLVEIGHSHRKQTGIKLRQPLASLTYTAPKRLDAALGAILANELNVKSVSHQKQEEVLAVMLDVTITDELKKEGQARELIRAIQIARKEAGMKLDEYVIVYAPEWPKEFEEEIKKLTLTKTLQTGDLIKVERYS